MATIPQLQLSARAFQLLLNPCQVVGGESAIQLPRWVTEVAMSITQAEDSELRPNIKSVVDYYHLTTLCGITCSSPHSPLSPYDALVMQGRTGLTWNAFGEEPPPTFEEKLERCRNNEENLEVFIPESVIQAIQDYFTYSDQQLAPFVHHAHSASSFAGQSVSSLPMDWLGYLIDLWRDRVLWFASTSGGDVIGVWRSSDLHVARWDDGIIIRWHVHGDTPTVIASSWWHFFALGGLCTIVPASETDRTLRYVWERRSAPPQLIEWPNSIAESSGISVPRSISDDGLERYHQDLLHCFGHAAATMISAYLPENALTIFRALHQW